MTEIEVYRSELVSGKAYMTAEWTRKEGIWPNERYFTIEAPRYVGKFMKTLREGGWGDGARIWSIFDDDGKMNRVDYTYEGTTSFIAIPE
jgi:hypothetical protein